MLLLVFRSICYSFWLITKVNCWNISNNFKADFFFLNLFLWLLCESMWITVLYLIFESWAGIRKLLLTMRDWLIVFYSRYCFGLSCLIILGLCLSQISYWLYYKINLWYLLYDNVWWCKKTNSRAPCLSWWTTLDWSRLQGKLAIKLKKEWDTSVWCLPKTLQCVSQKERKLFKEKMTWSDFWMSIYIYLWILLLLSFIVVSCLNGQWITAFMFNG